MAGAVFAFVTWGLLPLMFQAVARAGAGSGELVAWRVAAAIPVAGAMVLATGQGGALVGMVRRPKVVAALAASAVLIGINWALYVWAVQHRQTLAASLGYYINPLLNVVFGAWLFRERLSRGALVALALAAVGVALEAWAIGGLPWIALILAGVFGGYGVIRKMVAVEAATGLLVETLILALPTAGYLIWLHQSGGDAFGRNATATWLLLASGPATALPLITFALAARRLPLSVLGFLQFIQPTLMFAIGVIGGEPLTPLRLASFAFIWIGVAVFVTDAARRSAQRLPAQ